MSVLAHHCDDRGCPYNGQQSPKNCGCHETPEQMAGARIVELEALVLQYRDDMLYPPTAESRVRRLVAIDAAIFKIGARS